MHITEKATGTISFAGQSGSRISKLESRLQSGALKSKERWKWENDPQTSRIIRTTNPWITPTRD